MLAQIEVGNIRLFEDDRWSFKLSPLTVLCGTNSAGKSTLLRLLLLLRQSQGIRESAGGVRNGALRFVGSQVDLGSYESLVSSNDVHRHITIGLSIQATMPASVYRTLLPSRRAPKRDVQGAPSESKTAAGQIGDSKVSYRLRCKLTFSGDWPAQKESDDGPALSPVTAVRGQLTMGDFELSAGDAPPLKWQVRLSAGSRKPGSTPQRYDIHIPARYLAKVKGFSRLDVSKPDRGKPVVLRTFLTGLLPHRLMAKRKASSAVTADRTSDDAYGWGAWPLPPALQIATSELIGSLADIHYLAPLRSPAQRYYVAAAERGSTIDPAGEFLPYVLRDDLERPVVTTPPGQAAPRTESLARALNDWLHYLSTGRTEVGPNGAISVATTKDVLIEVQLKSGTDQAHALADSGFGYSQVLPILVRGLMASRQSTLVVEQPELHLNPALQVRLAEFFVAMMRAGKQVLIETHSEHMVNAIRVLAAEDETGQIAEHSSIIFISADRGRPAVHELSIQPDGTVPRWPPQFFGEALSLSGRLLRAQRRMRSANVPAAAAAGDA